MRLLPRCLIVIAVAMASISPASILAAAGPAGRSAAEKADAIEHPDPAELRDEIALAVAMGLRGEYGSLSTSEKRRVRLARERLLRALGDTNDIGALPRESRLEIYNAQQAIESILNSNDPARMVCTHHAVTGTRLKTTECLSIAERRARIRASVGIADDLLRVLCDPSSGTRCGLQN
jgi:hypothetical protein